MGNECSHPCNISTNDNEAIVMITDENRFTGRN